MGSKEWLRSYSSIEKREIEWLWYPYIPCGKITILQGDPGEGKSTFIINLIALLTRGLAMPDGSDGKEPMQVLYQCAEDDKADTIKPRLMVAGADCDRVSFIADDEETLTLDDKRIEQAIEDSGAKLFVLDPLQAYLPQDGDMQSAQRMRNVLRKLADIAARHSCAVVLVGHLNKTAAGKSIYRGLGSIDIAAIARSVLLVERDCDTTTIRYMRPIKASLAPEGPAIGFIIGDEQGFSWIGPCEYGTDNVNEQSKRTQAADEIQELLSVGDMESAEVLARLEELGVSRRTAQTAKKDLGVEAVKRGGKWYWRMPTGDKEKDKDAEETVI